MIRVEQAEKIIQSHTKDYGVEKIPLSNSLGRILAEDLCAERDFPPFNRPTMDGIAISFRAIKKGIYSFQIKATQAAGEPPIAITSENECIEIMTGSALSDTIDTVIPYEDIKLKDGRAAVLSTSLVKGQNIHQKGTDNKQGDIMAQAQQYITPSIIGIGASIGKKTVKVKKLPRTVIITTGDELVAIDAKPSPFQIRRSNDFTIRSVLQQYNIQPDIVHVKDNVSQIHNKLKYCLQHYDVILLSGGVSMGKFDYIPQVLEKLRVKQLFHKVQQRPGKPFWFGRHQKKVVVFAFPGNPVSSFMCLHRYFLPWLSTSLGLKTQLPFHAILQKPITFTPPLQYFMQVTLSVDNHGQLIAEPIEGNGSGDFSNLSCTNAFMELPLDKDEFKTGEIYPVWPYTKLL